MLTLTPTHRRMIKKLKVLRADHGMSQADLAEKSGVSREYIARLETGKQDPTITTLLKLAKALKVRAGALLE